MYTKHLNNAVLDFVLFLINILRVGSPLKRLLLRPDFEYRMYET